MTLPRVSFGIMGALAGLALMLAAIIAYLRFVFAGVHICGGQQVAVMLLGALIVVLSWYASHDARVNLMRRIAAGLFPLTAFLELLLYPEYWSACRLAGFVIVGTFILLLPYRVVSVETIAILGASTILTFVFVSIPLELVLRSDYSKYHLFGVYGRLPRDFVLSLNSCGYRDVDHSLKKPTGVIRILILGDSLTYGQGVADNEMYPRRLAELAGPQVEIITLARRGWSTGDELIALRQQGLAYDPDIVVVGAVTNDPEPPASEPNGRQPEWKMFTCTRLDLDVFRFLDYQINRLGGQLGLRYSYMAWELDLYDLDKPYWSPWQQTVRQFGELLESRGILAFAFTLPSPVDPQSEEYRQKYRLLAQEFTDARFQTVDLWPMYTREFASVPHKSLWAFPNDGHPSSELHAFYAREIWKVLQPQVENLSGSLSSE
jgi:lysophospholipase L1-like esterase